MSQEKEKYIPGKYEALLANILRNKLKRDSFIGNMLALVSNKESSEENCKQMYDYLQKNSAADYDEIMNKVDEILGIDIDEDDDTLPYYDDEEDN